MTRIRRAARLTGSLLVVAALVTACGTEDTPSDGAATSSTSDTPSAESGSQEATAAADWLAGELEGGLLSYRSEYGPFTDHGMSIDAALALSRVGGHDDAVGSIADAVAGALGSYTEFPSGKGTHVSAGATAKALVLAEAAERDPSDFGGQDLVGTLEGLVTESGRIADSFPEDNRQDADYANVIGQVYAARGLAATGSPEAGAVVGFLLDQQCEAGWFRLSFTADPAAPGQACDDDPKAQPDPDTTALAVVQLSGLAEDDADVASAVDDAVAWLVGQQADDGSLVGSQPATANANTTGLAGWAFGEAGETDAAASAASWVAGVQADSGAIAFDQASLDKAAAGRIPPTSRSQWLLATAQAVPALLWHSA